MNIALLQHAKNQAYIDKLKRLGSFDVTDMSQAELIIGVANRSHYNGTPIVHDIEFAYRLFAQHGNHMPVFIGITGTNGKTTVTHLLAALLDCPAAGNIPGSELLHLAPENEQQAAESPEHIVIEVASAQCASIRDFHPRVSIITNIRADHLDFHGSEEEYARAKARIFTNQTADDLLIYNAKDIKTKDLLASCRARKVGFDVDAPHPHDIGRIERSLRVPGAFNVENALACVIAADHLGVDEETIYRRLGLFRGVPHRMELIGEIHGMPVYDNSVSTNPDATINVLAALNGRGTLIMGGIYKEYLPIDELLASIDEHCSKVILYGQSAEFFKQRLEAAGYRHSVPAQDLDSAIHESVRTRDGSEYILFSPSCLAYDMFKNAKERGERFSELVNRLL